MKYLLDLIIAAAVIGCVYTGSRKGAVRMLISLAGYIAAIAAAVFVSNVATEYVYDTLVKPVVVSALESKADELGETYLSADRLEEKLAENGITLTKEQIKTVIDGGEAYSEVLTDAEFRDTLNHMFTDYCRALTEAFSGVLPDEILTETDRYINETDMKAERKMQLMLEERQSVTEIIEREIVRPVMLKTVKTVLFVLTIGAVGIIFSIISRAARVIREIPVVKNADSFFGGVLGFLQGVLLIILMNIGVSVFIKLTSDANQYLSTAVISETMVFKRLYSATFLLISLILK
ncbi:MAG: CvpA family protein [Oscillospiraceae bacterium]|nr:CvpA family protein [Oscillospiraceae bacterium]